METSEPLEQVLGVGFEDKQYSDFILVRAGQACPDVLLIGRDP